MVGKAIGLASLLMAVGLVAGCGHTLSEGDKLEILGGEVPGHEHSSAPAPRATEPGSPDDTVGGPEGSDSPISPPKGTTGGCAWYYDVAHTAVCVPNPLPNEITGKAACEYLRAQGYGPLHMHETNLEDPLKLDDNGDDTGCFAGDFGTPDAPPDASGGSILE